MQGIKEIHKSILFLFIKDMKLPATPTATKHTNEKIRGFINQINTSKSI